MTKGERVIAFVQRYCIVPEGDLMGHPVVLEEFQRRFILEVFDNPHGTDTAILSMARKNAKTALIAMIVLAGLLCAGIARQNSRIISGAMSKEQAAEVFNLAAKMVMLSPELSKLVKIVPSHKRLIALPMNTEYQATSAEAKTAHGKSPFMAILDEVGQIKGSRSDFVDAIITAQGAYKDALLIYISTQAGEDGDLLSIVIDDALTNKPPKTVCHLYAADPEADIMDEAQWYKANPALGKFRSIEDQRKNAERATRMPSFENTFRNLHLNQRVNTNSPFISRSSWEACSEKPYPLAECSQVYGALDLSARLDLTAAVFLGWHEPSHSWNAHAYAWTPQLTLLERSKRDRVPYDLWAKNGFLFTTPGSSIEYATVVKHLQSILPANLICMGFDRWRIDEFKKEMQLAGLFMQLEEVGQGYRGMTPALESLETMIVNKTLRHGNNPVLNMAAVNAIVTVDPAGNRKLDKAKATGRIDPFVCLAMSAGIAKSKHSQMDVEAILANPLVM